MNSTVRPVWVDRADDVRRLCERASETRWVAVDTEADSFHSYYHKMCLVQLSFDGVNALLDPLALGREGLAPLAGLVGDPNVITAMHGADYDLRILDRDLDARVRGLRDTQLAAQLLGEPQTGLAALLSKELGIEVDKRYQRADWGIRPLSPEMLNYAAGDTAHLGSLLARIEQRLEALGRVAWWLEECEALQRVRYEPPDPGPLAFERIKGARTLRGSARDRLAALFAWRERVAAAEDRPPFHVLGGDVMLRLAQTVPADRAELTKVAGVPRGLRRERAEGILEALASPPPAPPRTVRERVPVDRERQGRLKAIRDVRDAVAKELLLDPGVLAPRAALEAVVDALPRDRSSLEVALGRRWRAQALADAVVPLSLAWRAEEGDAAPA